MAAFGVKGVLLGDCRAKAVKTTPAVDIKTGEPYSEQDWLRRVEEKTKTLFENAKPKVLHPTWDFPAPAREFIEISSRSGELRDAHIALKKRVEDRKKSSGFKTITEPYIA